MAVKPRRILRRPALWLGQNDRYPIYLTSLTGEELLAVADISRLSRSDAGKLLGYQRPAVRRHIRDITEYLNGKDVVFPHSLILAFSSSVRFRAARGRRFADGKASAGVLEIPLPTNGGPKPAWIVDGQQRALAVSKSLRRDIPLPISAFAADSLELQRDQFLRVNNSKPLPRGLITELLPEVSTLLPTKLALRRAPAALSGILNSHPKSPFRGLIRRASTPSALKKAAVVADASIVSMIEVSLNSPSGCLFPYRNIATGETDFDGIQNVLFAYWSGVRKAFPEAWGRPAAQSRLMHGVGIKAMGRLMDRVMSALDPRARGASERLERELAKVAPHCHWTRGRWKELGDLAWNELQNVPRHVGMLSNILIRTYLHANTGEK
jgi:DGQHR domain-containing protein